MLIYLYEVDFLYYRKYRFLNKNIIFEKEHEKKAYGVCLKKFFSKCSMKNKLNQYFILKYIANNKNM